MPTMTTLRVSRCGRALTALVVAACLLLVSGSVAASASASDSDSVQVTPKALQLSLDGVTWTDSISTPLFDPRVRWVPGDVRTAEFFVRNSKPELGDLSVVLDRPMTEALYDTGSLSIAVRVGAGVWSEVEAGDRRVLVDEASVDPADALSVQLRASMDFDAPNQTMVLDTDLDLTLRLTQDGVVADATSDGGSHGVSPDETPTGQDTSNDTTRGDLPDTGSSLRPWILPLALLLLGAGAVLVARRTDDEEDPS